MPFEGTDYSVYLIDAPSISEWTNEKQNIYLKKMYISKTNFDQESDWDRKIDTAFLIWGILYL